MYKLSSPASWEKMGLGDEKVIFLVITSQVNVRCRLFFWSGVNRTLPLRGELLKSHLSSGKLLKWEDWKGAPTKPKVTVTIVLNSATSQTSLYQSDAADCATTWGGVYAVNSGDAHLCDNKQFCRTVSQGNVGNVRQY